MGARCEPAGLNAACTQLSAPCQPSNVPPVSLLQALHAECEAVRVLGSSMDHTNQALVDGMCDMSGGLPAAWMIFNTGLGLVGLAQLSTSILVLHPMLQLSLLAHCCHLPPTAGLVDAVQALQTRNRLLQGDLDTLKAKYAGRLWP